MADEKLTQVAKQQVYVPTTVGGGCCLGVSVVEAADTVTVGGARARVPRKRRLSRQTPRRARSAPTAGKRHVRRGGGSSPRSRWCCAFSVQKMKKHCAGQVRHQVLDRAWQVYQAATTRQFSQRLRRVAEWTPLHSAGRWPRWC